MKETNNGSQSMALFKKGFSKLTRSEKLQLIEAELFAGEKKLDRSLSPFDHPNENIQNILNEFSENTLGNFPLPFGVVPYMVVDEKEYIVPMVIEESSVVAACSKASKFWASCGGVQTEIIGTRKVGQIHFHYEYELSGLQKAFGQISSELMALVGPLEEGMKSRGGGLLSLDLNEVDRSKGFFKIHAEFETCDAMGANFINTLLEEIGKELPHSVDKHLGKSCDVIMCILSNYTPNCVVRANVKAPISAFEDIDDNLSASEFCRKFKQAVDVARLDPYRAVTHNKGIFNGVDAVVLATGNDFRAVEAAGHAYASRDGQYRSLSKCELTEHYLSFSLDIPLALGTVGGLTSLHPLADLSLEILDRPSSQELMSIVASTGLMQNFGALRSLVTSGIQKGHMKMHLFNILGQLKASDAEKEAAVQHFKTQAVSYKAVKDLLESVRSYH